MLFILLTALLFPNPLFFVLPQQLELKQHKMLRYRDAGTLPPSGRCAEKPAYK
jgi:hypothetical protein